MIFWTAFVLGLGSSLHCIGMCGPLAMALPLNRQNKLTTLFGVLQYHTGRIVVYALLGSLISLIGLSAEMLGFMQWVSIISGVFIVLLAWKKWLSAWMDRLFPMLASHRFISAGMGRILGSNTPFKLVLLGAINGLLPCGMVYAGLVNAMLAGNALHGAAVMALFGLGTLPAMTFVAFAAHRISGAWRAKLSRFVPVLLTVIGTLIILRGLNLNIPYLSPGIERTHTAEQQVNQAPQPEASMSCCHSKANCAKK